MNTVKLVENLHTIQEITQNISLPEGLKDEIREISEYLMHPQMVTHESVKKLVGLCNAVSVLNKAQKSKKVSPDVHYALMEAVKELIEVFSDMQVCEAA